jgi:uncharacterized paraquat-inducible protein A
MPDRSGSAKNKLRRERIDVTCSCGASLKAPRKAVGKRVKCPRCHKVLRVRSPDSSLDRALCALGDEEYNTPKLETQPPPPEPVRTEKGKLCPMCNGEMPLDAAFCIKCGYHLELGTVTPRPSGQPDGGFFSRLFRRK